VPFSSGSWTLTGTDGEAEPCRGAKSLRGRPDGGTGSLTWPANS
jgi:hypothetical protein